MWICTPNLILSVNNINRWYLLSILKAKIDLMDNVWRQTFVFFFSFKFFLQTQRKKASFMTWK